MSTPPLPGERLYQIRCSIQSKSRRAYAADEFAAIAELLGEVDRLRAG